MPAELSQKKGLINIKNNDQKCFLCCHVRHLNPIKIHPERIRQTDKELVDDLDYDGVGFPVREKDFSKIEKKNNICINVFCYENNLNFQFTFQTKHLKIQWICCLQLLKTSHIMCISMILTDLCFIKQKIKSENTFVKVAYSSLVVKMCRQNIKMFV